MTKPEPKEKMREDAALSVLHEQRLLLAELRRQTTLDDDRLVAILRPFSEAAYEAGYDNGFSVASWRAYRELVFLKGYRIVTLLALIVTLLVLLLRK